MDKAANEFLTLVEPCLDMWRSIDLRIQAFRDPKLGWRCECLRGILAVHQQKFRFPKFPDHQDLLIGYEIWPVDRLQDLLVGLEGGEVVVQGETVHLKRPAGPDQWQPFSPYYVRSEDRRASRAKFGDDWNSIVLNGYESANLTDEMRLAHDLVDSYLINCDPPWNGIADVRHTFVGLPWDEARRRDSATVAVVAPLLLRFGSKTSVDEANLSVEIEAGSTVNLEKAVLSIFATTGDEITARERVPLSGRSTDAGDKQIVVRRRIRDMFSGATCVLAYADKTTDRVQLFRAPLSVRPDWAASQFVVGGPADLAEALRTTEGGDPFEHAVATLFFLLGLGVVHYGRKTFGPGGDAPDIVAIAPGENWLLVVECTIREVDLGAKIAKLATRTKETQNVVGPYIAHPVLVTRQPRKDFPSTAIQDAAQEKVVLVTSDNFDDLVRFAAEGQQIEKLRDYLLQLIPSTYGM